MDNVSPSVTSLMMVQQAYINQTTPEEMHNIDVHLTTMCARWNALDKDSDTGNVDLTNKDSFYFLACAIILDKLFERVSWRLEAFLLQSNAVALQYYSELVTSEP